MHYFKLMFQEQIDQWNSLLKLQLLKMEKNFQSTIYCPQWWVLEFVSTWDLLYTLSTHIDPDSLQILYQEVKTLEANTLLCCLLNFNSQTLDSK